MKIEYKILSSLVGAVMIVLINLLAEPVATSLKFRAWTEHMSPLHNYGFRFITAFIFLYLFNSMNFTKKNKLSLPVFLMELGLIITLNIMVM